MLAQLRKPSISRLPSARSLGCRTYWTPDGDYNPTRLASKPKDAPPPPPRPGSAPPSPLSPPSSSIPRETSTDATPPPIDPSSSSASPASASSAQETPSFSSLRASFWGKVRDAVMPESSEPEASSSSAPEPPVNPTPSVTADTSSPSPSIPPTKTPKPPTKAPLPTSSFSSIPWLSSVSVDPASTTKTTKPSLPNFLSRSSNPTPPSVTPYSKLPEAPTATTSSPSPSPTSSHPSRCQTPLDELTPTSPNLSPYAQLEPLATSPEDFESPLASFEGLAYPDVSKYEPFGPFVPKAVDLNSPFLPPSSSSPSNPPTTTSAALPSRRVSFPKNNFILPATPGLSSAPAPQDRRASIDYSTIIIPTPDLPKPSTRFELKKRPAAPFVPSETIVAPKGSPVVDPYAQLEPLSAPTPEASHASSLEPSPTPALQPAVPTRPILLFLDTNVLINHLPLLISLHHLLVAKVSSSSSSSASPSSPFTPLAIRIPTPVLGELGHLRSSIRNDSITAARAGLAADSKGGLIRGEEAQKANRWLLEVAKRENKIASEGGSAVELVRRVTPESPQQGTSPDDQILSTCISTQSSYAEQLASDDGEPIPRIILFTSDINLAAKAELAQIETFTTAIPSDPRVLLARLGVDLTGFPSSSPARSTLFKSGDFPASADPSSSSPDLPPPPKKMAFPKETRDMNPNLSSSGEAAKKPSVGAAAGEQERVTKRKESPSSLALHILPAPTQPKHRKLDVPLEPNESSTMREKTPKSKKVLDPAAHKGSKKLSLSDLTWSVGAAPPKTTASPPPGVFPAAASKATSKEEKAVSSPASLLLPKAARLPSLSKGGVLSSTLTLSKPSKPSKHSKPPKPSTFASRLVLPKPAARPITPVQYPRSPLAVRREVEPVFPTDSPIPYEYRFETGAPHQAKTRATSAAVAVFDTSSWKQLWHGSFNGKEAREGLHSLEPAPDRPPVATLKHALDRVLFNPGPTFYRDPRSNVYNFDARLRHLPSPDEFDFDRLPPYITASKDPDLRAMAAAEGSKFYGSTSTLTSCMSQIYFTISQWKSLNTFMLSQSFSEAPDGFTPGAKLPASVHLIYDAETDTYAVDNDKSWEPLGQNQLLSKLGKVMEKIFTATHADLARFKKSAPEEAVPDEERNMREAYHYTKGSKLLMRSQLDGVDERLPGSGTFDIKTRATVSIRMDQENVAEGRHYQINSLTGALESFEKERYDMIRASYLKYSLQCRIGDMDGIFVAYHTTSTIQGFQYISVDEMDKSLFGNSKMGEAAFGLNVSVLEKVFEAATGLFPKQSVDVTMAANERENGRMTVIVQPKVWDVIEGQRPIRHLIVETVSSVNGVPVGGQVTVIGQNRWDVAVRIATPPHSSLAEDAARKAYATIRNRQIAISRDVALPTGMTALEMQTLLDGRYDADFALRHPNGLAEGAEEGKRRGLKKVDASLRQLRQISREGYEREKELRERLKGKPIVHWVQGTPLGP